MSEIDKDAQKEHQNSLTFDERVIKKIAGIVTGEIDGILAVSGNIISGLTDMLKSADDPTKGIVVEIGKKQVAIDMKVICEYGTNMPEIFIHIVESITRAIKSMTGLDVVEVNVHVSDILTKEDFDRKKRVEVKSEPDILTKEDFDRKKRVEVKSEPPTSTAASVSPEDISRVE